MINLTAGQVNQVIIYADTISDEVVTFGDYFLFGLQDTYTKEWEYAIVPYTKRNNRFINFQLYVSDACIDNPFDGELFLRYPGNWTYKIWNLDSPILDPSAGDLIDQGQMYLNEYNPPEIVYTEYVSDNNNLESEVYMYAEDIEFVSYSSSNNNLRAVIYYSGQFFCCVIDEFNSPYVVSGYEVSTCDPLYVTDLGFLEILDDGELYINAA
jgi:hypothetical protein